MSSIKNYVQSIVYLKKTYEIPRQDFGLIALMEVKGIKNLISQKMHTTYQNKCIPNA